MKRFSLLGVGALALLGMAVLNPALKADEYNRKTVITFSQPLEVPGVVLAPGTYVMRLFNSSSNRHIVQFMNESQTRQLALTFAIPAERIRPTGKTVLTMYEGSQSAPSALRTWYYPGDTVGEEFLYPHGQAVRISERTKAAVPEIETEKAAVVTPASPVQSSEVQRTETSSEPVLTARAEPAPEPIAAPEPQPAPEPEPQAPPATVAQSERTEPVTPAQTDTVSTSSDTLPQTASNGPLAALMGGLALVLALGMRKLKRSQTD